MHWLQMLGLAGLSTAMMIPSTVERYSPARLATKEALEEKVRVFNVHGATTHWAHDNIFLRPQVARLPDGAIDPRNRNEPLEKAEMTDRLKKLARLIPY